jgi:hypothetical protein
MSEPENKCSLLEELDQRQDEVLAQLDELNNQIESLLKDCLQQRGDQLGLMEDLLPSRDRPQRTAA